MQTRVTEILKGLALVCITNRVCTNCTLRLISPIVRNANLRHPRFATRCCPGAFCYAISCETYSHCINFRLCTFQRHRNLVATGNPPTINHIFRLFSFSTWLQGNIYHSRAYSANAFHAFRNCFTPFSGCLSTTCCSSGSTARGKPSKRALPISADMGHMP